ncbi:MAG: hypothetical protein M3P44_03925 [Actinomycetota bacterium]|nr:hypothetical protein [Actinomycetota bacterium]
MRPTLCIFLVALALVTAGCGSSGGGDAMPPAQPQPTAPPADFPSAAGKSLNDLAAMAETRGPVLAPSVSVLAKGENRFGFALFDTARKQITGAAVAVYTARNDGSGLRGPYVARSESLAVKPQFQSQTTASDSDSAKAVYVAEVPFKTTGKRIVIGLARLDGRLLLTNPFSVSIGDRNGPPRVGEKAVRIHTETLTDVGGDATRLDTRRPVAKDLLADDFADVMGKRPTVITFATPLLCQSRVCGPVVDVVEQVKATAPKDVAFIHQEIYNDNAVNKGYRPQVGAWRLPTEPWTFVVDRRGRIAERFQGAFSPGELQRAVAAVAR